jgi:hypothetical protein
MAFHRHGVAAMTDAGRPPSSFYTTSSRSYAWKAPREMDGDKTDENDDDEIPSKWDPSPLSQMTTPSSTSRQNIVTSLQILAATVSLFFVATLLFSQGRLLAVAPPVSQPPKLINAEEILQQDWQRMRGEDDE